MFCKHCGNPLNDDSSFCPSCGNAVDTKKTAKPKKKSPLLAALSVLLGVEVVVASFFGYRYFRSNRGEQTNYTSSVASNGTERESVRESVSETESITTSDGRAVKAFARPSFATLAPSTVSYSDAPALDAYRNGSTLRTSNAYGSIETISVTAGLSNVSNLSDWSVMEYYPELRTALERNYFVVDSNSGSSEFFDIYESNRYEQLANFVTVDSMMHSYHLYFQKLLKTTEKQHLSSSLRDLSREMMEESSRQYDTLKGSEWEEAALRNLAFFSVACSLLDSNTNIPSEVQDIVSKELNDIYSASGIGTSSITEDYEDYSQYKPRGYYEGDAALEAYFRAMMWYGRVHFIQSSESLSRSALLMTIALHDNGTSPNEKWESIYTITSFFAGASDDLSYYEYYPIFQHVYGEDATVDTLLENTDGWKRYHDLTKQMPAPKIGSLVVGEEANVTDDDIKGFRFMGQRFSIDETIFWNLVYDNVSPNEDNQARLLPEALDLPAALGSDTAYEILVSEGNTDYPNYEEQVEKLRSELANNDGSIWTASLYSQWLYTLNPLLTKKGEGYPLFMQSTEWEKKSLESYLGSYTELKHDTVLYSKQMMAEMGGDDPVNHDDRGYVEPEPELYGRLANLTEATIFGLNRYNVISSDNIAELTILQELAERLQTISIKELSGESLSEEEYELIRTYGGQLEHFWQIANQDETTSIGAGANRSSEFPAAVVVDIATNATGGEVLEVATGRVNTIYVLVPIDGELHLCSGGVFSFYEFTQPLSNRLTDSQWRDMLGITHTGSSNQEMPDAPAWANSYKINRQW